MITVRKIAIASLFELLKKMPLILIPKGFYIKSQTGKSPHQSVPITKPRQNAHCSAQRQPDTSAVRYENKYLNEVLSQIVGSVLPLQFAVACFFSILCGKYANDNT
ncbi:MAG: hypothetical protein ACJA13_003180 [Paraglaciecola sp.]|jgi:hypothetical protein